MLESLAARTPRVPGLLLLSLCTIGTLAAPAGAQSETAAVEISPPGTRLEAQVEARLTELVRERDFSGSILIAHDGQPLVSKGYGMAQREHGVPNTPLSKFRLGSITKQFAAAAILLEQERGNLDVRDAVLDHVDEGPETWIDIQIHHLLTHTSGITNFTNLDLYEEVMREPSRPLQTMRHFVDLPLRFRPGSNFEYSNSGYVVLAHVIEHTTGVPWEDYLRANVFGPLGMDDSGHDTHAAILPHRAAGYALTEQGVVNAPYHDMDLPIGGGDLYSTTLDLLKWDQALYDDRLLSDASREALFTPFKNGYAYGWAVDRHLDRTRIGHGGGIHGFNTQISRYVDERLLVVVLINTPGSVGAGELADELAEMALAGLAAPVGGR